MFRRQAVALNREIDLLKLAALTDRISEAARAYGCGRPFRLGRSKVIELGGALPPLGRSVGSRGADSRPPCYLRAVMMRFEGQARRVCQ